MFFGHFLFQNFAHAAVDGAVNFLIAWEYERNVKHFHGRNDGCPTAYRVQAHIHAAGHDGVVHGFIIVQLAGRERGNDDFALCFIFYLGNKGFHTFRYRMVSRQRIG